MLVKYIKELSGKKVLFITSTEQSAIKYSIDFERIWNLSASILPYQNTSPYETMMGNIYDYQKQIEVLRKTPDLVIAPIKVLTEKFPTASFFIDNCLKLKIGDSITQQDLLKKLISLGYKRSTMVSDMGEFSIRGDISDIYSLNKNPVRIEFWGDEIVDIRFFNNESIEKIKEVDVLPIYKFILPKETPKEFSQTLKDQYNEEGYFEGISAYQSFFNKDLVNVLDYFDDYIIVYDEYAELDAKLVQICETHLNTYNEALKNNLIEPLKLLNHYSESEIIQKLARFQKISLNNFLSDESNEVIDVDSRNIPIFDADMEKLSEYILERKGFNITIATDYPERVKDVLKEYNIFDVNYIVNINSLGTE